MSGAVDCDVLIAGGGPTGVALAILLAQRGVRVVVAEKEAEIYPLPRAAHLDHESMRILQAAGVADGVMATSRTTSAYEFRNADGAILLRFDGSDRLGPGGWPGANMIHQPSVEAALRARLATLPAATLRQSCELVEFADEGNAIAARLRTAGGTELLRARYLVGADGARSPVRKACGIAFDDLGFEEPWLVVDTLVDDPARLPPINLQICDPARPTTCVLMGSGRHRWEFMILPGEDPESLTSDAAIGRLLAPWQVDGAVRLERRAVYTFRARVAERWRQGQVLLAGDAAHQTPPFAGQGMCSGLRDAGNLAWKLAAIVRGDGGEALLDSYQREREPNLRATIAMAIMMGQTVCITNPAAAAARDAQMIAARSAGQAPDGNLGYPPISEGAIMAGSPGAGSYFAQTVAAGRRSDDALGQAPWLISRETLANPELQPFAPALRQWLDDHGAAAVMVRPDFHVFGSGSAEELKASWRRMLTAH